MDDSENMATMTPAPSGAPADDDSQPDARQFDVGAQVAPPPPNASGLPATARQAPERTHDCQCPDRGYPGKARWLGWHY